MGAIYAPSSAGVIFYICAVSCEDLAMPQLKAILAEHRKFKPKHSLQKNLGDGFLISHNPVFRSVREAILREGFRFSDRPFHDYDVLPLTQLPRILKSRTIPYRDNVTPLREVERRAPGAFAYDQIPKLRPNHLFHESAHGIAHSITHRHLGRPKSERERALQILIEESFANAVESLSNAYSNSTIHDEFLYKNAYIMEKPAVREKLRLALHHHKSATVLKTLLLSFLHANLIQIEKSARNWPRVRRLLTDSKSDSLRPVFKVGFDLDPRFTLFTNAFCLRLEGIRTDLFELLDFDFLEYFETREAYRDCLEGLSRAIKP